ncbi:major facilitator superfamily domain-containing protein [Russula ochroleuca]|uniref:Major facilitator superfamily domain-containing protein n=1 Tax=Russula ochroleuca TaxID=152965 RepID=A0A9P5TE80_9AGAM|nr:major facilitator superfamily domain-containing protein [Russula ochroleuca]
MQVNDGDNDSEHLPATHEGGIRGGGPPTVNNNATIHELNQIKTEALRDLDGGGFSWFRLKLCLVAGARFFVDAYDIFAINLASVMLGYFCGRTPGPGFTHRLSRNQDFGMKVAAPVGNLLGQLLFGWLADIVGRKRMYGIELMIIVVSTFAQALAGSCPGGNIIGVFVVWRFLVAMAVEGDYPLSAVMTSEFASTRTRGRLMTSEFTAQGWVNFAASLVALVTAHVYKDSIIAEDFHELEHVDYCWRTLIGLGCVPGAVALYFRLTTPETPRFMMDIDRGVQRARADIKDVLGPNGASAAVHGVDQDAVVQRAEAPRRSRRDFIINYFAHPGNCLLLLGVAYSLFAIDAAFLSSILTSLPPTRAGIGSTNSPFSLDTILDTYQLLHNLVIGSLVVSVAGLLLGYYAFFFLVDGWGRRRIQFLAFAMLALLLAVLAGIYPGSQPDSTFIVYDSTAPEITA